MNLEFPLEKKYPLGSGFGPRGALSGGKIKAHNHQGQDIAAPAGTKVKSVADGVVVRSTSPSESGGYGNFIVIKHKDFYSAYGHLSKREVKKGDTVKKGELIGLVGSTGQSTGPHLHFEIRKTQDGSQVDPKPYLNGSEINATILSKTDTNDKKDSDSETDTKTDDDTEIKLSKTDTDNQDYDEVNVKHVNPGLLDSLLGMAGLSEEIQRMKEIGGIINEGLYNGSKLGKFVIISDNTSKGHGGRKRNNWASDNAWDLKAPIGTSVYSFSNGVVSKVYLSRPGDVKVYGVQLSINGTKGDPDIFYTHLDSVTLKVGDKVKVGDYIGKITRWPTYPEQSHVHIGLPYGKELDKLISNNKIDMEIFQSKKDTSGDKVSDDDDDTETEKKDDDILTKTPKIISTLSNQEKHVNPGLLDSLLGMAGLSEQVQRIKKLMK